MPLTACTCIWSMGECRHILMMDPSCPAYKIHLRHALVSENTIQP